MEWRQTGNSVGLLPGEPWLAATALPPADRWPGDVPLWAQTARYGDRRQELGFIGMHADQEGVLKALRRALVTGKEYAP